MGNIIQVNGRVLGGRAMLICFSKEYHTWNYSYGGHEYLIKCAITHSHPPRLIWVLHHSNG